MTVTSRASSASATASRRAPIGRVLLAHHLGPRQAAEARDALTDGAAVVCLTADAAVLAELGDSVDVLGAAAFPGFEDGAAVDISFDLTDAAVDELLRRRPAVGRRLVRLSGSSDVDRYLRRWMLREAGAFLALLILVASDRFDAYARVELERTWPGGLDVALLAEVARGLPLEPAHRAALDKLDVAIAAGSWRTRAATAVHAVRELGGLWAGRLRLLRLRPGTLPERPLMIRSYVEDWGVDYAGHRRLRNLDFVVDGAAIAPAEVTVWAADDVPVERDAEVRRRAYAVLRRSDVFVSPAGLLRALPTLLSATVLFVRLATAERWWQKPLRTLCEETLLWREVGRRASPRLFLALNDLNPGGIARTLALRREGCLTVEYEFSSHWRTTERHWVPDYVYAFAVVDAMVVWGPLHAEHFLNHRGAIRECWDVGCLWSEHARLVREEPETAAYYRGEVERAHGLVLDSFDAVVGVFDTSTASFFTADDVAAFYRGILAVSRRLPRVLFLCKPKRPTGDWSRLVAEGDALEREFVDAPNLVLLDNDFETGAAVGLSDLSVNACFTSPAVETIGVGTPALYFDATSRFPQSFLRGIPDFVVTSEDDLAAEIEAQLARHGDAQAADLRSRFGTLEGHFDGLAITRLRSRIRAVLDA